jgi:hypothetical protein
MLILSVVVLSGCAAPEEKSDDAVRSAGVEAGGSKQKGEPIYSTSVAIRMAELILRERGLFYEDRSVLVSFCEGIYTVVFERPSGETMSCDYKVEIDANTSKILKVVTTR